MIRFINWKLGSRPKKTCPEHGSACEAFRRNGRHTPNESARLTEEGLGERRSAGLSRAGRRFARRTDALENRNRRLRFRLSDENRSDDGQTENGEGRGARRFRRSGESERVVGRRMRRVMAGVRVMVAIIVTIVMKDGDRDRTE